MHASVACALAPARRSRRWSLLAAFAALFVLLTTGSASAAERTATTSSFASTFSAAQGGDTILLASGDYGTFSGGSKASMVTIKEQPGATAKMKISWSGAKNITVEGLDLGGGYIDKSTNVVASRQQGDGDLADRHAGEHHQRGRSCSTATRTTGSASGSSEYEGRARHPRVQQHARRWG